MKRLIYCAFAVLVSVTVLSCASAKKSEVQERGEISSQENETLTLNGGSLHPLTGYSFLKEKDEGCELTVTGLFAYGKPCILTENPDGRNRVTFVLEVPEELDDRCRDMDGETVTVSGVLTDAKSTWSKKMTLTKIMQ